LTMSYSCNTWRKRNYATDCEQNSSFYTATNISTRQLFISDSSWCSRPE